MNWSFLIIAAIVIAVLYALKRASFVSQAVAKRERAAGALVIDVRTAHEFENRHLSGALNIPLSDVRTKITQHAINKNAPLLVHCLSGGRSAIAAAQLRSMGYKRVFNLGSYRRAEKILRDSIE